MQMLSCGSRTLLVTALALSTVGLFAPGRAAADGPYSTYKPYAAYSWSGFYVGGHAGYGWGDVNFLDFGPVLDGGFTIDRTPFRADGVLAGGQIGYQQQFGRWVAGVELSFSGGQLSDSASQELVQPFTLLSGDKIVRDEKDNLQARVSQLFLATARLGYSWDRWLAYGKGGFASADIKTAFQANVLTTVVQGVQLPTGATFAGQSSGSSSDRHSGWTLGTGLEYMVARNVTFGVEYNFINLQDRTQTANATISENILGTIKNVTAPITYRVEPDDIHLVTARLSFKFGP
jgi:outer membrane immunogenic protein